MFDNKSDFGEMAGETVSGIEYKISPSQLGQERNILEEFEDTDLSYEEFRQISSLHGSLVIPRLSGFFKEKYGLSEEQEGLLDLLLENAIIHGNENDPNREVSVKVLEGMNVAFKITDQGQGFYPRQVLEDFEKGRPYSKYFGWGTYFAAKCTQSLVRYSRQGNSVEVLFLKGDRMPKPYFSDIPRG